MYKAVLINGARLTIIKKSGLVSVIITRWCYPIMRYECLRMRCSVFN